MFLYILWFLFFKSNFFQYSWHTIQRLHLQCILWWVLTNVYTRVTTTSTWHRTFPSLQSLLSWLFAVDSPILVAPAKHLRDFYRSRPSCKWNPMGCTFSCLASLTQHNVWDTFTLLCLSAVHFFSLLSSNPLFEYVIHHSVVICLPVDTHSDFFPFWALTNKTTLNIHTKSFCDYVFLISFRQISVLKVLRHMISIWLTLEETTSWFSRVANRTTV